MARGMKFLAWRKIGASTQATPDTRNTDDSFNDILESFHPDDIGNMCRNDPTIKKIGKMLWNKDRAKVDKTDEVRKTVIGSMRNLFIEFKKQLECVVETTEASLMFDRMHWASLSEAITNVMRRNNDGTVKYALKNPLFNLLMSSADILEGVALTDTETTRAADELAHFKKELRHNENTSYLLMEFDLGSEVLFWLCSTTWRLIVLKISLRRWSLCWRR